MYKKIKIMMAATLLASATLFSTNASAQDGFGYARFNLGYDFRNASATMTNTTATSATNQQMSLGAGFDLGLAGGYMFNKNVGIDLELNYLIGSPGTITNDDGTKSSSAVYSSSSFRIVPAVVISAGMEGLNPYARFGLVLGVSNSYTVKTTTTVSSGSDVDEWKYSGGMAMGISAAAGVMYPLNEKLMLFGELTSVSMSWAPTSGENTSHTSTISGYKPTTQPTQTYVSSISGTPAANTGLESSYPFSSIGIHVGLAMKF